MPRPDRPTRVDPRDRAQLDESPVSLARVAALFRPHAAALLLVTTLIATSSVLGLAQPFLVRTIVDDALPHADTRLLALAVLGMLGATLASAALGIAQGYLTTRTGQRVMTDLRVRVYEHLSKQSLAFFTRTRAGEVQTRLTSDIAGMQSVITDTTTSIAANLTTVLATSVAMVALSWRMALLTLVVLPPAVLITRRVALARRDIQGRQQRATAALQAQVDETLSVSGALLTKTLGAGEAATARFRAASDELAALELRAQVAGRWRMATMSLVFAAVPALVYLAAGFSVTGDGMTVGTLVAFTTLQASIFRPLQGLLSTGAAWVTSMALFSRVFGYLDLPVDVSAPAHPVPLPRATGALSLDDVTFTYPGASTPALDGVSLDVPAGAHIALVGTTGSGKSTLASLVSRLADPTSGAVRLDGIDLRDLDPADLARAVGVVTQETYLVHASIRDNLLLAAPSATDDELWAALRSAQADFVRDLPDGLDTLVGARGHRFSGGEKQRIAIARTLLRDPAVLVLDEATSALDNATERALQDAFDRLSAGRTTLTIAHRLSTIASADLIVVLDHGRVVETGTHAELLIRGGRYAELDHTLAA